LSKNKTLVGIDIGSSRIRTVVANLEEEKGLLPNVVGVGTAPSSGLRKGAIVDANETISAITAALEEAERMSGEPIHHAVIGVGGSHIAAQISRGVIAIGGAGSEITEADVGRVLEAAQAVHFPPNRKILRVVPQSYIVDDQPGIQNPVGMTGVRLEVEALVITGMTPALKNLENAIHQSGVDIDDFIPTPLASAEAVIGKRQKELGVVSIDIGASSTSLTVYEENVLLHTAVLPIGGESVTNDVAIGLRTSVDTAEKLKIEYGTCLPNEVGDRDQIDLSAISRADTQHVSRRELAEITRARYEEILQMVRDELKAIDRDAMLPAGAIITGAAAKIPGLVEVAREMLKLPVQIGFPTEVDGVIEKIDDPSYATVIGLVLFGAKGPTRSYSASVNFGQTFEMLKNFAKKLLP